MRNRGAFEIQLHHILLGLLDRFANRHGHFASLAHAETGVAALVTDDDQRREREILSAFHYFRDAVDRDHLILQVRRVGIDQPADGKRVFELLFRHRF